MAASAGGIGGAAAGTTVSTRSFFVALALLGVVWFTMPPRAAPWLGLVLVLGALVATGGGPIAEFRRQFLEG